MQFIEITEDIKTFPGEYIYHEPTNQIVLCGSFNRQQNEIKVLSRGRLFVDKIENFKKINMPQSKKRKTTISRCKGCKK
jgi:hypothetical protein